VVPTFSVSWTFWRFGWKLWTSSIEPVKAVTYKWSQLEKAIVHFARKKSWMFHGTHHVTNWHFCTTIEIFNPLTPEPTKPLPPEFSPTISTTDRQPIELESCGMLQEIRLDQYLRLTNLEILDLRLFGGWHNKWEDKFRLVWPRLHDPGFPTP